MNENLGIMRFHSVSTATIHAFVTDLDILVLLWLLMVLTWLLAAVDRWATPCLVSDI